MHSSLLSQLAYPELHTMIQSQAGAQVPLYYSCSHCQHKSLLCRLAYQGLQIMLPPQAGEYVPLQSCDHCRHSSLLSS